MSSHKEKIKKLREDFTKGVLSEDHIRPLPSEQFDLWIGQAVAAQVPEAQAMTLGTVSENGRPSARIVYLREFEKDRFWFYGNYNSRKAKQIMSNPHVSLTFFWPALERQVRIEGIAEKADAEKSDQYFNSRPQESKIGAWSSPQSSPLTDRAALEKLVEQNTERFKGAEVPRPEFWGGFVVKASYYEFWQGRKSRLHDRISFTLEDGAWKIARLAP